MRPHFTNSTALWSMLCEPAELLPSNRFPGLLRQQLPKAVATIEKCLTQWLGVGAPHERTHL